MPETMELLKQALGYDFSDASLLEHALTHSSFANEKRMPKEKNNQRLEFLGDAVLELVSSEYMFKSFGQMTEGEMTKMRASLVCEPTLADCARRLQLENYILLGKGEAREGINYKASVLSDTFEAIIGAIYLDGGLAAARNFIHRELLHELNTRHRFHDSKTLLQEQVSRMNQELRYELLSESGPEHRKLFRMAALIDGRIYGEGEGHSKKQAEQLAADQALLKLDREKDKACT